MFDLEEVADMFEDEDLDEIEKMDPFGGVADMFEYQGFNEPLERGASLSAPLDLLKSGNIPYSKCFE